MPTRSCKAKWKRAIGIIGSGNLSPFFLPVQTVGVMGDQRTYDYTIALRVVESQDGMTADWVRLPYELLARISNRIVNEVKGVNRVVYDISTQAAEHDRVGIAR